VKAEDILNNTDPAELRNIIQQLRRQLAGSLRPPPTEIVNTNPGLYPPLSSEKDFDLGWINVKDHGAVGDGASDDRQAINNAIAKLNLDGKGVLYFPPGKYICSAGLTTITADALIMGVGAGSFDDTKQVSKVICTSSTAVLFTVTALYAQFSNLELSNTASAPVSGAGIQVSGSSAYQKVDFDSLRVYGFYINIDIQTGVGWIMKNCVLQAPVLYAVKIRNTVIPGIGNWLITDCIFHAGAHNSAAAIRIESGGGGKITSCDIEWGADSFTFEHGIDINSAILTGFLTVSDCLIGNIRGHGIRAAGAWVYITVDAVQFGLSVTTGNNTGNAINITGINGVIISSCLFNGGSTPAAISLTSVNGARIVGNINTTFSSLVTQSGCSGVVIIEPAAAVTSETSYGQASSAGASTLYAREDHTHGTPALSAATPQDVGSSGGAGSGSTPSKSDHVHEGVHSLAKSGGSALYGDVTVSAGANITITPSGNDLQIASTASGSELLMQDGVTAPPIPVETEARDDWLYRD